MGFFDKIFGNKKDEKNLKENNSKEKVKTDKTTTSKSTNYVRLSTYQFDTPEEYVYKIRYLAQTNQIEEATNLCSDACAKYPDKRSKFTGPLMAYKMFK